MINFETGCMPAPVFLLYLYCGLTITGATVKVRTKLQLPAYWLHASAGFFMPKNFQ